MMIDYLRPLITRHQLLVSLGVFLLQSSLSAEDSAEFEKRSIANLEQRLATIDQQLAGLSGYTMRSGVGSIGYRSIPTGPNNTPQWVQINLKETVLIDQVVLVPEILRGSDKGFQANAFPIEFQIRVGLKGDEVGKVVAHRGLEGKLLPRIAPVVVSFPKEMAAWVRIEAIKLSPRAWDHKDCLQFAEVLVFSGQKNVALHQKIDAASSEDSVGGARNRKYLVDGFIPYIMDSNQGKQSVAFLASVQIGTQPKITIDLEAARMVDQINLHTVEVSDSIPQALANDFAIPRKMIIEAALHPDFSDSVLLTEYRMTSIYDTGSIISRRFPQTQCRYIRITVIEPYLVTHDTTVRSEIGFAEIELLSAGNNLALNKPVSADFNSSDLGRSIEALTDGRNFYGRILPMRTWLEQLALRHDLETERPRIEVHLKLRYARQQKNLNLMLWLVAILIAATIIIILIDRIIKQRAIHRTRERIAADLHDEFGANLHALGLLSDLAEKSKSRPEKLSSILKRIRNLTERTGKASRYITNMLEAKGIYEDVPEQIRRSSTRMLADLDYDILIEGEDHLKILSARQRVDLCLFNKECLTNILRHAEATKVSIELTATAKNVLLIISDNGRGLTSTQDKDIPKSIKRRSRLLKSQVHVETPETGGTRITLTLYHKKLGFI